MANKNNRPLVRKSYKFFGGIKRRITKDAARAMVVGLIPKGSGERSKELAAAKIVNKTVGGKRGAKKYGISPEKLKAAGDTLYEKGYMGKPGSHIARRRKRQWNETIQSIAPTASSITGSHYKASDALGVKKHLHWKEDNEPTREEMREEILGKPNQARQDEVNVAPTTQQPEEEPHIKLDYATAQKLEGLIGNIPLAHVNDAHQIGTVHVYGEGYAAENKTSQEVTPQPLNARGNTIVPSPQQMKNFLADEPSDMPIGKIPDTEDEGIDIDLPKAA